VLIAAVGEKSQACAESHPSKNGGRGTRRQMGSGNACASHFPKTAKGTRLTSHFLVFFQLSREHCQDRM